MLPENPFRQYAAVGRSQIRAAKSMFWRALAETRYKMACHIAGMSDLLSLNRRFINNVCRG
jgi:hypothetical protein